MYFKFLGRLNGLYLGVNNKNGLGFVGGSRVCGLGGTVGVDGDLGIGK